MREHILRFLLEISSLQADGWGFQVKIFFGISDFMKEGSRDQVSELPYLSMYLHSGYFPMYFTFPT